METNSHKILETKTHDAGAEFLLAFFACANIYLRLGFRLSDKRLPRKCVSMRLFQSNLQFVADYNFCVAVAMCRRPRRRISEPVKYGI